MTTITLRSLHATPSTIILRTVGAAVVAASTVIYLTALHATPTTIIMRSPTAAPGGGPVFPTQYSGLRYFHGSVQELCLVAVADAPSGAQWRIDKNGTTYAVYLVDTTDPDASPVRVQTPSGVKAARYKT
jgi:hypothetical protein